MIMNKVKIGIFFSLVLGMGLFSSCGSDEGNSKLLLNEVLVNNQSNFQDDYGIHSPWIEIFNKSYGTADLAGCYLRHSSQPGDTAQTDCLTVELSTPTSAWNPMWTTG